MYLKCKRKYHKVFLFKIQPGNKKDNNKDASVIESYLNLLVCNYFVCKKKQAKMH